MKTEKKRRVVITGLGTVNPTGNTVAESWAAIKDGRCAVEPITAFDTADFKVKLAAEVKDFDPAERIDRREARKMARFTQFAVAAADEAIHDSGIALENIAYFGAMLAVNLAVVNLLPIPALDGGRILFLVISTISLKVFKKKIPMKYEAGINFACFALLMVLILVVTFNDVARLFS